MFQHILLPTDGSELSEAAASKGIEFARALGARVTGIYVMPEYQVIAYDAMWPVDMLSREQFEEETGARAERVLASLASRAAAAGVACETMTARSDHPWEEICKAAESRGCDLILMSSHGRRGLSGLLLGSETTKVLTHTRVPVLVYR